MAIIPFVILIILIVGLYIFQGYAFHKGLKWVFYVCITILLTSTIVYYFLPENSGETQNLLTHQEIDQAEKSYENFYVHAQEGKLDSVEGVTRKEQWLFDYSGDTLEIPEDDRLNMIQIMVERKKNDDNQIEVKHYSSQYIIDRIDYSDKIESPTVLLQGNKLKIIPTEEKSVDYSSFKKDFVVTQFDKKVKDSEEDLFSHNIHGSQVIYIRIPTNVQITDGTFIQYVGEDY